MVIIDESWLYQVETLVVLSLVLMLLTEKIFIQQEMLLMETEPVFILNIDITIQLLQE